MTDACRTAASAAYAGKRLGYGFYSCSALELSEKLLGKVLVHVVDGVPIGGVITETEAYMGVCDKASHAYGGRRTSRTETMYLAGGHAYVYLIYGMYSCMNITAAGEGNPEAVLIRSVAPYFGTDKLYELVKAGSRRKRLPENLSCLDEKELLSFTNGPGKLCIAMGLSRENDKTDLVSDSALYVSDCGITAAESCRSTRVGIDYAEEAALYPWRFTAVRLAYPESLQNSHLPEHI